MLVLDGQLQFLWLKNFNTNEKGCLLSSNEESRFLLSDIENHIVSLALFHDRHVASRW